MNLESLATPQQPSKAAKDIACVSHPPDPVSGCRYAVPGRCMKSKLDTTASVTCRLTPIVVDGAGTSQHGLYSKIWP